MTGPDDPEATRGDRRDRRRRTSMNSTRDLTKASRLDETDRSILSMLARNSRHSAREIARRLGISVGVVLDRMSRLQQDGVVRGYRVEVDPEAVGYPLTVTLGIQLDGKASVEETMAALIAIPEVHVVHWVTSHFDMIATLCIDDLTRFQTILMQQIRAIPGFLRSESMISIMHWRRVGGQFAFIWPSPGEPDDASDPSEESADDENPPSQQSR